MIHSRMIHRTRFFDEKAPTWNQSLNFPEIQNRLCGIISRIHLTAGDRVLDAGTGTGVAIKPLLQAVAPGGKVIGVDISMNMLLQAKPVHRHLIRSDCHCLPFPAESFHCIFAFAVVPHIDETRVFFNEVSRLLKPAGKFAVVHLMSREKCNDFHRKAGTPVEQDYLPSRSELDHYARQCGLTACEFSESENTFFWMSVKSTDLSPSPKRISV